MAANDGERKARRFRGAVHLPCADHLRLISRDAGLTKFRTENLTRVPAFWVQRFCLLVRFETRGADERRQRGADVWRLPQHGR